MIELSVSALSELERCERCFWLYIRGVHKPQVFPSILNAMDKLEKGILDGLAKRRDGYVVIDFKTSASPYDLNKANHFYQTQMSAYAYLCEANGYRPVVGGELIFYCPSILSDKMATFEIFSVPTIIDMDRVEKLLERANMIAKMDTPPPGSCEWCRYREGAARYERGEK